MKRLLLFVLSFLSPLGLMASPLEIGAEAPAIKAIDQDGNEVDLGELFEKGTVLVFFYPKANTSGCTAQACSLRDAYEEIEDRDITVVGVSTDSVEDQKEFQEEHRLPFTLIADPEGKVVEAFGVPKRGNFASRQAFLIRNQKVVWRDLKASTAKQAEDVLAALDEL